MGIKGRLIAAIVIPVIVAVSIVSVVVYLQMRETVNTLFLSSADQQLVLVQDYVNKILDSAKNTSVMLANFDETKTRWGSGLNILSFRSWRCLPPPLLTPLR
jgi:hypothetical protein